LGQSRPAENKERFVKASVNWALQHSVPMELLSIKQVELQALQSLHRVSILDPLPLQGFFQYAADTFTEYLKAIDQGTKIGPVVLCVFWCISVIVCF